MYNKSVKTNYGVVVGKEAGASIVFKGIPYARPPIGEFRWRRPEKPIPFKKTFQADTFGNRCPQVIWNPPGDIYQKEFYDVPSYNTPMSEDCLYLNIWVPKRQSGKKMPVLLYIHGGAFTGGNGNEKELCTDVYAKRDVILVTINYRLGFLGFLTHPWLMEEDPLSCGNYGILDQIAAIEWVRDNITEFGGDKNNITICGQSAGGMSVIALLATVQARGMFQKAIIQSSGGYPQPLMTNMDMEHGLKMGEELIKACGVSSPEQLRKIPIKEVLRVQNSLSIEMIKAGKGLPFGPIANGHLFEAEIDHLVEQGKITDVPTIIGTTKNDITVSKEEALTGKSMIHKSCMQWSILNENKLKNPSYVYIFNRNLPGDENGAFHSSDLWYVFGTLGSCWRPMTVHDYKLSETIVDYWANFCKTGNPNDNRHQKWRLCTEKDPYVEILK